MIDPKFVSLIHRRLVGEITPSEDAELTQHLASSAEARSLYEQLSQSTRIIGEVCPADHPAPKRGIRAVMGSLFTSRLAYGLAAGVVLAITTGAIGSRGFSGHGNSDPSSLASTMISGGGVNQSHLIDTDSFKNDQFSGRLFADTVEGVINLHLELESSDDVSMIISFEGASYVLKAFAQTNPIQNTLTATNCALYLTHQGKNEYVFALTQIRKGGWPYVYLQGHDAAYRRRVAPPGGVGC